MPRPHNQVVSRLTNPTMRVMQLALIAIVLSACGSGTAPAAAEPSPTFSAYDSELLAQLQVVDFQIYETAMTIGGYVFSGAGLNYDRNTLQLGYGGLVLDEWKAVGFNPAGGKCSTADPAYSWNCSFLTSSPHGHMLYAGPIGGLRGSPADLGDVYVELGSTVVHVQRGGGHTPSLGDLEMFADGLKLATPDAVVRLNQKARDYQQYLDKAAASRIDFKTYLPRTTVQDFTLDRKFLGNPTDPLHPYLDLHFGRIAKDNEKFEFSVDEFRDGVPLSSSHCGFANPELNVPDVRCLLSFKTPKGTAVYSTYSQTRFDLPSTRVVVWLSLTIDNVSQQQMADFVDSFAEVSPQDIGAR